MSPAKFSFDVSSALTGSGGPPPTGNCLTDFVVYGLNVAGSSQANLVAIDDLYSGRGPTGLCGSTPKVKWAYNVTTLSGGTVTTSPVLSWDGTMVAFVESNGSASVFHVLKWLDSNGTVGAPVTPAASSDAYSCAAPCMVSLPLSSATTRSSPFGDYSNDAIYVGNNNGQLFKITDVFGGPPAVSTTNGWSATGVQVAPAGVIMTAPVLDLTSGNIFIGGSDGKLYAVSSTSGAVVGSIAVGSGSANGGGIVDAPTVDGTSGTVLAYAAANAALVGATAANTTAVTVQATTSLGSVQVATIGYGSRGSTANLNAVAGDFDNSYYTWSGSGSNTGHFYMVGTGSGGTSPTLYQIPYSGIGSITVTGNGGGYTTPSVSITGDGSGAAGSATGGVDSVTITAAGSGYTGIPNVTFTAAPAGGVTATGTATVGLSTIPLTADGSNYTLVPGVTITGTGTGGGAATAALGVDAVSVTAGGSYTAIPTVGFPGGSATGSARVGLVSISATGGSFTSMPTITITPTGGGGAAAPTVAVTAVGVTAAGSGYAAPPTISFAGTGSPNANATALMGVNTVTVGTGGSYATLPTVTFSAPPSGTTATGTVTGGVLTVNTPSTSACYRTTSGAPTITFSGGGGGTGAHATATLGASGSGGCASGRAPVTSVTVTAAGTGYTSAPTMTFSGGNCSGTCPATDTVATMAVTGVTVTLANAGSGYLAVPTPTFSSGAAAATVNDLRIVGTTINTAGSYTTFPTASTTGNATLSTTVTILSAAVTTAGSYSTYPTASAGGGSTVSVSSVTVVGVAVGSAGTGYTAGPFDLTFSGTGGATATADLKVVSVTVTAPGSYTAMPTATFTTGTGGGGSGATLGTLTVKVVGVTMSASGSGYTTAPGVTFSSGGATATATINVTNVSLTYGGGGYSTATVNITGGTTNATATANINAGSVMTRGTPPTTLSVSGTPGLQASPITEILNGSTDLLFFGYGSASVGELASENVTTPSSISAGAIAYPVPPQFGGTSGIVVDNISAAGQASSIYFSTLATGTSEPVVNIASVTIGAFSQTYTATTLTPHGFAAGDSVVIANVLCNGGATPPCTLTIGQPNGGPFTITTVPTTTSFTYINSGTLSIAGGTSQLNTGTATDTTEAVMFNSFQAIKLTQSALQ
jgi:hypothetical protein